MLIGNDYKIESDGVNVTLSKKYIIKEGKNAGSERWEGLTYHRTLEQALNECVRREINATYLKDVKKVVERIKQLEEELLHESI